MAGSGGLGQGGRGRLLGSLLVVLAFLAPLGATPTAAHASAGFAVTQAPAGGPPDLPATALTPDDAAAAGTDGALPLPGGWLAPRELAEFAGTWTDQVTDDDLLATLEEAGLGGGHGFSLRRSEDPEDPKGRPFRDIYGSVHGFADAEGAEEGLALFDDLSAEGTFVAREESGDGVGDEAVVVRLLAEGTDETDQVQVAFRADRVLATVRLTVVPEEEPPLADAEALAVRLAERVEAALDGEAPGLGVRVPRLADDEFGEPFELRADGYVRRDGEDVRFSLEPEEGTEDRAEAAGEATDAYEVAQFIQGLETDDVGLSDRVTWRSRLYRFEDEEGAAAWFEERVGALEAGEVGPDDEASDPERLDDVPDIGDESAAFAYGVAGEAFDGRAVEVVARFGAVTVDNALGVFESEASPEEAMAGLSAVQAGCFEEAGCPTPLPVTDALAGRLPTEDGTEDGEENEEDGGEDGADEVLDLAGLTLTPEDLADAGLDGYGVGFGEAGFLDGAAASVADRSELSVAEAREALEDAGYLRRHGVYLYLPADEDDPAGPAERLVVSYVVEFAGEEGAADAWDLLEDESGNDAAEDVDLDADLGDEAEATREGGEDSASGDRFEQLDLTVRLGNLHLGVAILDLEGDEPDLADAEALAERLLERVEEGRADAPGLGSQVARLAGDGVLPSADYYLVRDGDPVRLYGEAPADAEARAEAAGDADQTDVYRLGQQVAGGDEDDDADDTSYLVDLLRFADEDAASDWLAGTEDRIAANRVFEDLEMDGDAPAVGEEAVAYTVTVAEGGARLRGVTLRVGATVAVVDVIASETPAAGAVEEVAAAQAACLEAGGCPDPVEVPPGLGGDEGEEDDGDEDGRADGDDEGGGEDDGAEDDGDDGEGEDDGAAATELYADPEWDYAVAWDPEVWIARSTEPGEQQFGLVGNTLVSVTLRADEDGAGDAEDCLDDLVEAAEEGAESGFAPADESEAPETAEGAAGGLYALGDFALIYFECRTLVPGEAVLQVRFGAPVGDYEAARPALEALLAGIEVG